MTKNIEKISPHLKMKISRRARRVALRLDARERVVELVVPYRSSIDKAVEFASENKFWIHEKINTLPSSVPFRNGMILPICGREVEIRIFYDKDLRSTDIQLKKNELLVYTNQRSPAPRIRRFLENYALKVMRALADEKASRMRRKPVKLVVRDTKTRWGSCSEDGHISLSWRLIFAPPEAMDYVVAHELAHLLHMDHSTAFWNACRRLSENYLEGRYWMQNYGHELMRYGTNSNPRSTAGQPDA